MFKRPIRCHVEDDLFHLPAIAWQTVDLSNAFDWFGD